MGPDKIPPKLVKLAANIIDCHTCNILNITQTVDVTETAIYCR